MSGLAEPDAVPAPQGLWRSLVHLLREAASRTDPRLDEIVLVGDFAPALVVRAAPPRQPTA